MKASNALMTLLILLMASCGKSSDQEKIDKLYGKIRVQEEKIRKSKAGINELRREIAELGGDTLPVRDSIFITVTPVVQEDYVEFVELAAVVSSRENLMVSSELGGRITQMHVREGQSVNKGQIMAEVDAELIDRQIAELETALSLARTVYEKRSNLWEQRIGSELEYLQAENQVQSLEKSLATAQTQLDRANLRAPISGVVDKVMMNAGEMVSPGQPIVRIVNLSRVQVNADISEAYLGQIKRGDTVRLNFPAAGIVRKAAVSAIGQVIDPNNRTFVMEVDLDNRDGALKPNLAGTVSFQTYFEPGQIQVPSRLVQSGYSGKFVYIMDSASHLALRRPVELGKSYDGRSVITSGLRAGEWLVDDGFRNVIDSSFVQIHNF